MSTVNEIRLPRVHVLAEDRYSYFSPAETGIWVVFDRKTGEQVDSAREKQEAVRKWQQLMGLR